MSYALQTLWHEKARYAAGVGAVAFSAVLIALQVGLLLGLFELTSIPVDHTSAHIWVGDKAVESVDLGRPIPASTLARLDKPGVSAPELYFLGFANFTKHGGGSNLCMILGSDLGPDAAGAADVLTPDMRAALSEPRTIVVDSSDLGKLGMERVGDHGSINGREVRLVGTVAGLKSLAAPWIFCSQTTARELLSVTNPGYESRTTYLLAKCDSKERAEQVVAELRRDYPEMSAYTAAEFSTKSRMYWLFRTKAGIAIGYAALLGLVIGAVITAQTLYSATMGSAREFATLLALGIPRRRIYGLVLRQSVWVGLIGVVIAGPVVFGLGKLAESAGAKVALYPEVLVGAGWITLGTALAAGVVALRSVRRIEPMSLLR
ncbi:MAG: ABC transporter permease [Gemmataceae bacterium]